MRALVTGGAGFIGSHVVEEFLKYPNADVVVVDNESSIDADTFNWVRDERVTNFTSSVTDFPALSDIFADYKFDYVFHLAAKTRIVPAMQDPPNTLQENYVGLLNVLELSRNHAVRRVVFSSSSSVYGTQKIPYKEWAKPDCLNPYALSKLHGESLCKHYSDVFGLDTVCLRYFNVFGERMPERGQYAPVIAIFLRQLRENVELTVVGDGLQRRDFIYVNDVAEANILSALRKDDFSGECMNVGSTEMVSVLDIAKLISENYVHLPPRKGDAQNTQADISKICKEIEWAPTKNVMEWIKETVS